MIDFLITRYCGLQFSSLVLKQTDHTPMLPPPSVCLLGYSAIHSLFICPSVTATRSCSWSLNTQAPTTLVFSLPNSTPDYLPRLLCFSLTALPSFHSLLPLFFITPSLVSSLLPPIKMSLKAECNLGGRPKRILKMFVSPFFDSVYESHYQCDVVCANRMSQRALIMSNWISPLPSHQNDWLQTKWRKLKWTVSNLVSSGFSVTVALLSVCVGVFTATSLLLSALFQMSY